MLLPLRIFALSRFKNESFDPLSIPNFVGLSTDFVITVTILFIFLFTIGQICGILL